MALYHPSSGMAPPGGACEGMRSVVDGVLWPAFGFYTITMTMYYNVSTAGVSTMRKSGTTKVLVPVKRINEADH